MNNIQKSFKKKSELRCMADGGKPPYPATEYDFATSHGGAIKGPGGPTDDKVGPVMLSNKEYVLPADTVKAIGKDKLDALRHATHKFVDSEPGGLANGGAPFYVDPDGVATRGAQPGRALVPMRQPGASTAMTIPESLRAPATPAFRPEVMGEAGRASARAAAFDAAGNPLGASRVAPAAEAVRTAAAGAASVTPSTGALSKAAGVGGSILRGLGRLAGGAGGVYGLATGGADIAKNGANVTNVGDTVAGGAGITAALASGAAAPIAGAAATGWGVGRAIGGNLSADTNNAIGGTINEIGLMAKKRLGFGWGDENAYVPSSASGALGGPQSASGAPSATPVADASRGTGSPMANEKPPSGPQYYDDLERLHQQELAQMRGGNREAGARAAAGGGPGAGQYPGLVENRSGQPNKAITGADPNSYYASRADGDIVGSFNGRNITKKEADARAGGLQTASGQAMKPEGDPAMAEIRSALRGIGGGGGGNWAPRSQADEINARYDALMRGGSGRNIVKGSDWSQRHGLDVEMARARELGADASNQSTLRGQNMQAGSAADQTRMSGITKMMELQAEREKAGGIAQAAAIKAQQDALKQAADANQQGYENFTKNVSSMFPDADPTVSATKQQEFMDFVSATDPEFLKKEAGVSSIKDLFALGPQEQMAATQKLKVMLEMQQARNKSVGDGTILNNGPRQTGFDAPVGGLRDAAWGDVANSNLSVGQYLYSNLPFTDNRVQELASGSVVPYDELVGNSADREKARKSNLRNP